MERGRGKALFEKVRNDFLGLNTHYRVATGELTRRIYLDSTATTLMMGAAHAVLESFYSHYANTHSLLHFGAKISTREFQWAHERILSFLHADPDEFACFAVGSGTTAGINRMARIYRQLRPDRDVALVSIMEHHSNDLPHRKHMAQVYHVPVAMENNQLMCVSLPALKQALEKYGDRVNYVALTGVSNVTGIINPIKEAARLAHEYGAYLLVDGAQTVAHLPVYLSNPKDRTSEPDALVFSGHKTYVPGSPGIVVARKRHLAAIEPVEVGGGMVDRVFMEDYWVKQDFPDREEAGTPNIPGLIALAAALEVMDRIGMEVLQEEEDQVLRYALERLKEVPDLVIYGSTDLDACPRAGSIAFNLRGLDHGFVAAVLNDYFNISVRNQCFCAHPYVKTMIQDELMAEAGVTTFDELKYALTLKKGMVRASFAMYSTREDADELVRALTDISTRRDYYRRLYHVDEDENYVHNDFAFDHREVFSVAGVVDRYLGEA